MIDSRPFDDFGHLAEKAEEIWNGLAAEDWLEAFAAHPKIGSKKSAPSQKERAAGWSKYEQSGSAAASETVLSELEEANRLYERRFGYIFIVCATGKSADEMLGRARERLKNMPDSELVIAGSEQNKITRIRLEKLFG
jgi:OHCU decarboxylase